MQEDHQFRGRLRFGVFELDLRAGELRKHGLRVRLQEQPFQVLAKLLEHPGEVVTREELQSFLSLHTPMTSRYYRAARPSKWIRTLVSHIIILPRHNSKST
jgi:hypothetical protein